MATTLSASLAKREGRTCAVPGCTNHVRRLSNYCALHERRAYDVGDPRGLNVTKYDLRPYVEAAHEFLDVNREHPGITAALEWIDELVSSSRYTSITGRSKATILDRVGNLLCQFHHRVTPETVLAHIFAMFALRHERPFRFVSEVHWHHQLSKRVLKIPSAQFIANHKGGGGAYKAEIVPPPVARVFARMILTSMGVLSMRAGEEIVKRMNAKPKIGIPHQADPFVTTIND